MRDILIIYNGDGSQKALDAALLAAQSGAKKVRVLLILDSELYHYGHVDLVAPRLNKQKFLLYIREQVLEKGGIDAAVIREKALSMGVPMQIDPVETDDLVLTVITEARKGYEMIFLKREKKRIFPLLKKDLARELHKIAGNRVFEC